MDPQSLAVVIGSRVRHERTARGWTLDRLAELAGISRRMVINVEQGSANPSIGTLLGLSDALGVGLPSLVEPPEGRRATITRAGEGAVLWTGPEGGRGVLVAASEPPDIVELWDWRLHPGEDHESEAHSAGTRELVLILDGVLTLTIAGETSELAAGDAMSFSGDEPHSYANHADTTARFSLTVFEPGVGTDRRKDARHD